MKRQCVREVDYSLLGNLSLAFPWMFIAICFMLLSLMAFRGLLSFTNNWGKLACEVITKLRDRRGCARLGHGSEC